MYRFIELSNFLALCPISLFISFANLFNILLIRYKLLLNFCVIVIFSLCCLFVPEKIVSTRQTGSNIEYQIHLHWITLTRINLWMRKSYWIEHVKPVNMALNLYVIRLHVTRMLCSLTLLLLALMITYYHSSQSILESIDSYIT